MVQGGDGSQRIGDPPRWREGNRTRTIDAEFNNRRHQRGVMSAARVGGDINSASSQFFIMTADYPSLDGQYSAFGRLQPALDGYETLDEIANAPGATGRDGTVAPSEPQQILQALVVRSF
jgi:peptidyl-prolyl cis-trans isomerase B (cyclophilin B)